MSDLPNVPDLEIKRFKGDSASLTIPLYNPDTGATDYAPTGPLLFTLKESSDDPDTSALIQKLSNAGGLTLANPAVVSLVAADATLIAAQKTYPWDILDTATNRTVAQGTFWTEQRLSLTGALAIETTVIDPAAPYLSAAQIEANRVAAQQAKQDAEAARDTTAAAVTTHNTDDSAHASGIAGNAATATTLETPRAINGVSFDGSEDVDVPAAAATLTGTTLAAGVTLAPGLAQQNPVIFVATAMANGSTVAISEYGDSTTAGYISGSVIGSTPAPSVMQSTLQSFYQNPAISVANHGVAGATTTTFLPTWAATLAGDASTVIILNFGMNDNVTLTGQQFADNLRSMIAQGRAAGKLVLLKTPNPARQSAGSPVPLTRCEGSRQYADIVRTVGREMNVAVIDIYKLMLDRWASGIGIGTDVVDGVHPSDAAYQAIGRETAWFFMGTPGAVLYKTNYIPVTTAGWRPYTNTSTGSITSVVGVYIKGEKLRCAIRVAEPGTDIYFGSAVTSSTSSSITASVDGVTVGTINQYNSSFSNSWPADCDVQLIENAAPGVHLIALDAPSGETVVATYLRAWPTRIPSRISLAKNGGSYLSTDVRADALAALNITSDSTDSKAVLTDIPMSYFLRTLDVQFYGTFPKGGGVLLMANNRSSTGSNSRGGVIVMPNTSTGYLQVQEGNQYSYASQTVIYSTDVSGAEHLYRITITPAGLMSFYVDGASVGTYTLTTPFVGGKFGLYCGEIATVKVRRLELGNCAAPIP